MPAWAVRSVRVLVTGAAGFIGSNLSALLLSESHSVVGVDAFTDYYDPAIKRRNIEPLLGSKSFELLNIDLTSSPLPLDSSIDVVFHLAAQPGVRGSWGDTFSAYVANNVAVTQRVLERVRQVGTPRVVYASSSSIYGDSQTYPTYESDVPAPHSPYGVTKLAGEHLCRAYGENFGISTVSLRYFTVYGPRQRPDMAIARLIDSAVSGRSFPLYGDGGQIRDFTFVDDVARATALAATADVAAGSSFNVAGGSQTTMLELVATVEEAVGKTVRVDRRPAVPGDVQRTGGSTEAIAGALGWRPEVDIREGIKRQVATS